MDQAKNVTNFDYSFFLWIIKLYVVFFLKFIILLGLIELQTLLGQMHFLFWHLGK